MAELELVRLNEDGEHLVLRAPDGTEHALPITEALRAAVRRDRPLTEALQAEARTTLRPRELQSRLRAGATAEELAAESGLPVEHVQRYEWPVVAEREHAVSQVRAHRIDGDPETTLGAAADTRLAARGVAAGQAVWTARREGTAPWVVEVRFSAGERERSARWTFDPRGRVVTPLDDEARWLAQPDDPLSPEMVGVPSIAARFAPRGDAARRHPDASTDATALLLDDLAGRRGQRPGGRSARRADDAYQPDELDLDLDLDLDPGPAPRPATGAVPRVPGPPRTGPQPVAHVPAPWTRDARADGAPSVGAGSGTDSGTRADSPADPVAADSSAAGARTAPPDAESEPAGASVVDLGSRRQRTAPDPGPEQPHSPPPSTTTDRSNGGAGAPERARTPVSPVVEPAPTAGSTSTSTSAPTPRSGAQGAADPRRGTGPRRPARKGRAQVPSWDEIVFGGARPQK